jgi:hypothetical protein
MINKNIIFKKNYDNKVLKVYKKQIDARID